MTQPDGGDKVYSPSPSVRRESWLSGMSTTRNGNPVLVGVMLLCLSLISTGCVVDAPSDSASRSMSSPPTVSTPVGSSTPTFTVQVGFPPGLDEATSGLLYAETDGAVLRVDLQKRSLAGIITPRLRAFRSFVATRRFLVVKQTDDAVGFMVMQDGSTRELPQELGGPGRLYAAGRDAIWVVPEEPSHGRSLISQFSTATNDLRLLGRRAIPGAFGIPWSDAAGQLVAQGRDAMYVVTRSSMKPLPGWRRGWELLGIGKTSMLVKTCPQCNVTVRNRDRSDKRPRATAKGLKAVDKLLSTYDYGADGHLSPDGRYMAMTISMKGDHRGDRLAVTDLVTGKTSLLPGSMTRINPNDQFTWLHHRWLLAVSDQTLRIVDTRTGTIHTWRDVKIDRIAIVDS